ncbi:bifunctional 2-C-methyl-D-erythritol 4-phosphate cytidylyltransferase/2-C-methyl-D-erythritol 2,4-cyclodiphosphate synthase [Halocynthiibacter namhaensis]|uniref:bifunctional 2-C-methyl-D-erythritol 4-phosphate cytidylyltransferase/2-C-methyl-D-erythritol 2,4-cyclodiphosphate synthase n=1 Tax=Halocynthiibacter namhaensis TaxID=1290553 RepID=UPI0005797FE0|nr:bifunctional 2-C-methyl-D-erythritol 4-phosphate cytidylyltransferase/2-C-methyl-D-erythritol 2,4-cyclodiphosphate synthase [Halocynthiibacter namhaensis]
MQNQKTAAIIVAAGTGTRAASGRYRILPKQYQTLASKLVIDHSLLQFAQHPDIDHIVLVIRPQDREFVSTEVTLPDNIPVQIVDGGAERDQSVGAGLQAIPDEFSRVLIHDGARPMLTSTLISRVCDALNTSAAAAPAVPVTDALWRGCDGVVRETVDRSGLWRAQTPQGFHLSVIRAAHANNTTIAADDVEVARANGVEVQIVLGDEDNIKITHPQDFRRAETLLSKAKDEPMDIRVGNGYDVHRFGQRDDGANDHVVICGVKVPHDQGMLGHSDADVGMHALTDAIYGALAEGDIGQHFPPSDMKWKNVESHIFLSHAVELVARKGFSISNMDCTLVCEFPKIGPVSNAMRERLAEICGIDVDRVSVKATTSEKLGFTGRGEGIASLATVSLIKQ